jgi:hypothetical protein
MLRQFLPLCAPAENVVARRDEPASDNMGKAAQTHTEVRGRGGIGREPMEGIPIHRPDFKEDKKWLTLNGQFCWNRGGFTRLI